MQKKGQNSQEISKTFTLGDRNLITCRKVRAHAGFIPSSVHRNIKTLPVFCIPPQAARNQGTQEDGAKWLWQVDGHSRGWEERCCSENPQTGGG